MRSNFITREAFGGLTRNATMTIAMIITTAISWRCWPPVSS